MDERPHLFTLQPLTSRLEMQALRSLRGECYTDCIEAVEQYTQLIREKNISPAEARYYQLLLYSSIDQQIRMQHGDVHNSFLSSDKTFDTMDQMRDATIDMLTELDVLKDGSQEGLRSELVANSLQYIQDHLSDQSLTMETQAAVRHDTYRIPSGQQRLRGYRLNRRRGLMPGRSRKERRAQHVRIQTSRNKRFDFARCRCTQWRTARAGQ